MQKLFFSVTLAGLMVPFAFLGEKKIEPAVILAPEAAMPTEYADGPKRPDPEVLGLKVDEAIGFCRENNLNTKVAILIDLGLHSGYSRCWVVGLNDRYIKMKGLVSHGSGTNIAGLDVGERKYSNTGGSLLSSLGKYKTGQSYYGKFGLAYKLFGLEKTNSNAYSRAIVLHGHSCVTDYETTYPLCQSWGCPTVSPNFLKRLQQVIDASEEPVLLWVYDSVHEG